MFLFDPSAHAGASTLRFGSKGLNVEPLYDITGFFQNLTASLIILTGFLIEIMLSCHLHGSVFSGAFNEFRRRVESD